MRKRSAALVISLLAVVIFGLSTAINAQNVAANTCSQTDVQTAISAAASGDTVTVPSGNCSWSGSAGVTITKAIHLQGNGIGSTAITYTSATEGNGAIIYSPTTAEAVKGLEVNGFTFQGGGEYFNPHAPSTTIPITGLKIHDNAFNGATHHAIHLNGSEFGVFYNNTFSTNFISIWVGNCGTGAYGASDCEMYDHTFGSAHYPYFEDNTFGNGAGEFVTETGQGGRLAFRHNTITGYACSGCEVFDIHGDQNSGGGTVSTEIYHNTIGVGSNGTYRWLHHRGGGAIIANNTVSRGIAMNFTEYRAVGQNGICSGYIATGQIHDTNHSIDGAFYFNNLAGGSQQTPGYTFGNGGSCGTDPPWGDNQYVVPNREYWLPTYGRAASLPATCTANGNTYYGATDTDVIYKCTTTNTWSVFYQPYTYPHPLRAGSLPASPTNLNVVVH